MQTIIQSIISSDYSSIFSAYGISPTCLIPQCFGNRKMLKAGQIRGHASSHARAHVPAGPVAMTTKQLVFW